MRTSNLCFLAVILGLQGGAWAAAPTASNSLSVGATLKPGQSLRSTQCGYRLDFQISDGNLVVYSANGLAGWTSNTANKGAATLTLQSDSNLVQYTSIKKALWASDTVSKKATHLILEDDGRLQLRTAAGATVWSVGTAKTCSGSGGGNTSMPLSTLSISYQEWNPGGSFGSATLGVADYLAGPIANAIGTGRYGGRLDLKTPAPGYFRTKYLNKRWWLIDPDGNAFISTGLNSVDVLSGSANKSVQLMRSMGFNTLGAWSDTALRSASEPMPWTKVLDCIYSFAKEYHGATLNANNMDFVNDVVPVLDSRFEGYCRNKIGNQISSNWIGDKTLIGYFIDNELPWRSDSLDRFLSLASGNPNRTAARTWLNAYNGGSVTDSARKAFVSHIVDKYYKIVSSALRSVDGNHLFLGSRLHGHSKFNEQVIRAAGPHVDVLSINHYGLWEPRKQDLDNWLAWSGKPLYFSEFYIKASSTGKDNKDGAGDLVRTHKERGYWYQNFTLSLLSHPAAVGWSWHRFNDQYSGSQGSNKGFLTYDNQPYTDLVTLGAALNKSIYPLADWYLHQGTP